MWAQTNLLFLKVFSLRMENPRNSCKVLLIDRFRVKQNWPGSCEPIILYWAGLSIYPEVVFPSVTSHHMAHLRSVNLYWGCDITDWEGLVQGRISTFISCFANTVLYRECLKFPLEKDNSFVNLLLVHHVFQTRCPGHSYPSPKSTQIYTLFPTHPTSSLPFFISIKLYLGCACLPPDV